MSSNDRAGVAIAQPRTGEERAAAAEVCCEKLDIPMPLVVDGIDDRVGNLYSGVPDRLYIVDRAGRVAYKGGRGPFEYKPGEMEQSLAMLLLSEANGGDGAVEAEGGPDRAARAAGAEALSLDWKDEMLTVRGPGVVGGELAIRYIEAYCRAGSTDRDWGETVIGHRSELRERSADGRRIRLVQTLADGVEVEHEILAGVDEVTFEVLAANPTLRRSEAHWAQPCVRVDRFTGVESRVDSEEYLSRCFIFMEGDELARLPTRPWATKGRYTPGQVYGARGVSRGDLNPRPVSELVPGNGLIGCYSADGTRILAMAWSPYQELFQGVIVCLHSDFRIGGLEAGERKRIRGKLYLMRSDVPELLRRYRRDF
jgi:hypothetical protein